MKMWIDNLKKKRGILMIRKSGILMPMSSLPSPYGIGTMGKSAYRFVDFLKAAGQSYWQLLPLGPTSYGDSPYSSFSTFAGNPYYIDLDLLVKDRLLKKSEIADRDWGGDPEHTDYAKIYAGRFPVLRKVLRLSRCKCRNNMSRQRKGKNPPCHRLLFPELRQSCRCSRRKCFQYRRSALRRLS